jgi:hypothetical protein
MVPADEPRGIPGVARLGDHLEPRFGIQQHPQPDSDYGVIIG